VQRAYHKGVLFTFRRTSRGHNQERARRDRCLHWPPSRTATGRCRTQVAIVAAVSFRRQAPCKIVTASKTARGLLASKEGELTA